MFPAVAALTHWSSNGAKHPSCDLVACLHGWLRWCCESLGVARSMAVLGMLGARVGYGVLVRYIAGLVSNAWNAWIPHIFITRYYSLCFYWANLNTHNYSQRLPSQCLLAATRNHNVAPKAQSVASSSSSEQAWAPRPSIVAIERSARPHTIRHRLRLKNTQQTQDHRASQHTNVQPQMPRAYHQPTSNQRTMPQIASSPPGPQLPRIRRTT